MKRIYGSQRMVGRGLCACVPNPQRANYGGAVRAKKTVRHFRVQATRAIGMVRYSAGHPVQKRAQRDHASAD